MKWNSDPLLERIEQKLDQLLSKNITTEDQDEPIPKLLKIEEAADSLRCDERTIRYYLFEAKSLPYLKLGKEARIRESDLSGFIENLLKGQSSPNKELL